MSSPQKRNFNELSLPTNTEKICAIIDIETRIDELKKIRREIMLKCCDKIAEINGEILANNLRDFFHNPNAEMTLAELALIDTITNVKRTIQTYDGGKHAYDEINFVIGDDVRVMQGITTSHGEKYDLYETVIVTQNPRNRHTTIERKYPHPASFTDFSTKTHEYLKGYATKQGLRVRDYFNLIAFILHVIETKQCGDVADRMHM